MGHVPSSDWHGRDQADQLPVRPDFYRPILIHCPRPDRFIASHPNPLHPVLIDRLCPVLICPLYPVLIGALSPIPIESLSLVVIEPDILLPVPTAIMKLA